MKHFISAFILLTCIAVTNFVYSKEEGSFPYFFLNKNAKGPFLDYIDSFITADSEKPFTPLDSKHITGFTPKDSGRVIKISGEYRMNMGFQWSNTDDFYWKYANTEMLGYNFRYLYGPKRYNTFNPNIYNSFKLTTDIEPPSCWSAHMDMIVDPWASLGKSEGFSVISGWGAKINLKLPYWSNTARTRNITIRSNTGDTLNIPEIKVTDGKTEPTNVLSGWGDRYFIPAVSIDRDFRPIKNLWIDMFSGNAQLRIFPYADSAYRMVSDDPLGLCDNHIYWEPSPWISYWTKGVDYSAAGWAPGYWTADTAEGRQGERLRQLRGVSFKGDFDRGMIEGMAVNSIGPWDDYDQVDNLSFAGRIKADLTDLLTAGSTYTGRAGFYDWDMGSMEEVYGFDFSMKISPKIFLESEIAGSNKIGDIKTFHEAKTRGEAVTGRIHYKDSGDIGDTEYKFAYTYMADDFYTPLAVYANTSNDQGWSNHIEFKERSHEDRAIRIGDGIDKNRHVFSIRNTTSLLENRLESFTDYRQSNTAKMGKFTEAVTRNEVTAKFSDYTTGKTLVVFHKDHPGEDRERTWIFGGGLDCRLNDQVKIQGIFERANEYPYWPQAAAVWLPINPNPPYKFFNMYKFNISFEPFNDLVFEYNHCRNGYKYATGVDDNINYDGVDARWRFLEKFGAHFVYKHSRVIDLNHQIETGEKDFRPHDNFYVEINWEVWKDKFLKIQYSDLGRFVQRYMINPNSSTDRDSIQPDVLDRQDILRITYAGKF